ncbi:MAG: sigma-70 family RNA polymerase sigma factor [Firmicutes bacterium]|nr:sigma-70 family RNA polymerase sigma factor [Bacillota bacterium]
MEKFIYIHQFCDGTISEIEVSGEHYALLMELDKQEQLNDRRETRRHISFDYLSENGVEFSDENADLLSALIKKEKNETIQKVILQLPTTQQRLIRLFFFEEMTIPQIAKKHGLNKSSISRQLQTIYKKLKKLL